MKMPELSRTSHVGHFLVLSSKNPICDVIMWRHMTSQGHTVTSLHHMIGRVTQMGPAASLHIAYLLRNEILPGDLDLWPMTYNRSLDKVTFNTHTKNQGHRSNVLAVRVLTDTHRYTHGVMIWLCQTTVDHGQEIPPPPNLIRFLIEIKNLIKFGGVPPEHAVDHCSVTHAYIDYLETWSGHEFIMEK